MSAVSRLIENPFDLRRWQDALFEAAKKKRFLLVRSNVNSSWTRVIGIDFGNCVVQFTSDGKVVNSFNPAASDVPPFQLGNTGEAKSSVSLDGISCNPPPFLPSRLPRQPNVGDEYNFGVG